MLQSYVEWAWDKKCVFHLYSIITLAINLSTHLVFLWDYIKRITQHRDKMQSSRDGLYRNAGSQLGLGSSAASAAATARLEPQWQHGGGGSGGGSFAAAQQRQRWQLSSSAATVAAAAWQRWRRQRQWQQCQCGGSSGGSLTLTSEIMDNKQTTIMLFHNGHV
jgi:hypothetical protein